MVAAMSAHCEKRASPPVDTADGESCRPDFAIALYPGHLAARGRDLALNPDIRVTRQTPTFLLQAENGPVDPVENALVYHEARRRAGVAAELRPYAEGGHAFGLRQTGLPITGWPRWAERWLQTIGMIAP